MSEESIGQRLKSLRERVQMSQADVSAETGIAVSLLSRYEREVIVPGWGQIEKILEACNATPCDLFEDYCAGIQSDETKQTFTVDYFERRPPSPEPSKPTAVFRFRKGSPLVDALHIAPTNDRYALIRAATDAMIPDIYPGDLMLSDREMKPAAGKVIAGYYEDEPVIGRLVRHGGGYYLVPSNRRYTATPFDRDKWDHRGVILYVVRDLSVRFVAGAGFVDESSDVMSISELRKRGGGAT